MEGYNKINGEFLINLYANMLGCTRLTACSTKLRNSLNILMCSLLEAVYFILGTVLKTNCE